MAFVEFFGSEWRVIWSAPLTFTTAAVSVAGLVYAFARWAFQSRLDTLKDRIALKDDQLGELRDKLLQMRRIIDAASHTGPEEGQEGVALRQLMQLCAFVTDALSADLPAQRPLPTEARRRAWLGRLGGNWHVRNIEERNAQREKTDERSRGNTVQVNTPHTSAPLT